MMRKIQGPVPKKKKRIYNSLPYLHHQLHYLRIPEYQWGLCIYKPGPHHDSENITNNYRESVPSTSSPLISQPRVITVTADIHEREIGEEQEGEVHMIRCNKISNQGRQIDMEYK